jgi:hypothetical protein
MTAHEPAAIAARALEPNCDAPIASSSRAAEELEHPSPLEDRRKVVGEPKIVLVERVDVVSHGRCPSGWFR